ncbi:MAG: hypothetical protein N2V75_00830 [Methanophagales archaeon]|nr:hypothetical protein [Methanophagales archaeon]
MQNKPIWKILAISIVLLMVVSGIVVVGSANNVASRSSINVSDSKNAGKCRISTENGDGSDYGIKWDREEIFARQPGWDVEILMEGKEKWK